MASESSLCAAIPIHRGHEIETRTSRGIRGHRESIKQECAQYTDSRRPSRADLAPARAGIKLESQEGQREQRPASEAASAFGLLPKKDAEHVHPGNRHGHRGMPADRQDDRAIWRAVPAADLHPREVRYCQSRKHAIEHFAGRWAAKEAILKAMGTGWSQGISWTDLEVRDDENGQPHVMICGVAKDIARQRGIADILISISHCRTYATAYAMALSRSWDLQRGTRRLNRRGSVFPAEVARLRSRPHHLHDLALRSLAGLLGPFALGIFGAAQEIASTAAANDHRAAAVVAGLGNLDCLQVRTGARRCGRASSASCSFSSSGTGAVPRHLG